MNEETEVEMRPKRRRKGRCTDGSKGGPRSGEALESSNLEGRVYLLATAQTHTWRLAQTNWGFQSPHHPFTCLPPGKFLTADTTSALPMGMHGCSAQ